MSKTKEEKLDKIKDFYGFDSEDEIINFLIEKEYKFLLELIKNQDAKD